MHFRPARNWMNDPNGLVFHDGSYHLFFQYNPHGADHAHMSWGHATSADLLHWDEQPIALRHTDRHEIFSGSIVVDEGDTSRLGDGGRAPLVAVFTLADQPGRHQSQGIASSVDDGMTWRFFPGNPVLDRGSEHFRDPKVFRYRGAEGEWWVMVAVEAADRRVVMYRSDDLRTWTLLSDYGQRGAVGGVWECPDLFPLALDGDPDDMRWVLLISLYPGGIAGGSGTQYVIGSFDGERFVPAEPAPSMHPIGSGEQSRADLEQFDWLDYGRDCYAGVTFSGLPDDERILIAWMSNWDYAGAMPPAGGDDPQRGAMTLPRRLSLVTSDGRIRLRQEPIAPEHSAVSAVEDLELRQDEPVALDVPEQVRIRIRLRLSEGASAQLSLGPEETPAAVLRVCDGEVSVDRRVGAAGLPDAFASVQHLSVRGGGLDAVLWLDDGSLELFADDGTAVLTDRIPTRTSPQIVLRATDGNVRLDELTIAVPVDALAVAGEGLQV
ncbi:glycoside hydrolase family 32 protein [Microbacterium sp. MMO-10]|uniref:glycoside hydrolase family 32 protein n=1 Tax=Microbacterium sp. MMO-10 TaxID=3081272 RepID=UPI003017A696